MSDLYGTPTDGGFMGMLANPQTAGMLGMAGGLLQASGPSRLPISNGQAMGLGLQGMGQGFNNALQMQRGMMQMRMLQGLMGDQGGGAPGGTAPASASQPMAPVGGTANVGPLSGLSAGMGGMAPSPAASAASASSAYAPAAPAGALMGKTPAQMFHEGQMWNLISPGSGNAMIDAAFKYDPTLAAQMPTDATKMGVQAGMNQQQIQQANADALYKSIASTVRPGGGVNVGGRFSMTPSAAPAGYMNRQNADGSWAVVPVGGALDAVAQSAAAAEGGKGSVLPFTEGKDAAGNPLPIMSRTQAATGNLPLPLRNNNPGAVSPGGQVAQYPDLQTGLAEMDKNLASYAGQPGTSTLGGVITKWVGSPPNAPAYIKDVSSRLGIGPNTPVDLTNPAQRQAISTAIMLHENGPSAVFQSGQSGNAGAAAPAGGGAIYAAAPMGAQTFAQGQVKQMQDRWNALRDQNGAAQTVRSQLQNIMSLAPNAITGAEADKRAYVNGLLSLVGIPGAQDAKTATDLLGKYSNQIIAKLGQGGLGTDAARSIVEAGNPNAHMTVQAIQEAGRNLDAQYQMTQAKAALLQNFANGNNPSAYSNAETTFDRNADPRIWEWQSIQDPAMRQRYAHSVLQQDPKFGQRIQALEKLGALQ